MKRITPITVLVCGVFALAVSATATASMMNPDLGAKLAGMGHSGVVNLTVKTAKGEVCWTFDLKATGLTGASIREGSGMAVVTLGSMYQTKGCAMVSAMKLEEIEAKPGSYSVWVNTKTMAGDIRGTLFAGMAHASTMASTM